MNQKSPGRLALLLLAISPSTTILSACAAEPKQETKMTIPASMENAVQALKDSPRHGEWIDITVPGEKTKLHSFVAYPERKDKAPVVIVIHEIFGLTDWIRAVADQLAAEGFLAIAPDLLSGKGPNGGGTSSFAADEVRATIQKLTSDEVTRRLDAVFNYGTKLPSAAAKSAVVGFCWGGSASFAYATRQPKLAAAVVYYGTAPTERDAIARIHAPVLGHYGGDDARVTSTVEPTKALMKELKKSYAPYVYEGAGHGFLRQQEGRDDANRAAARKAWEETIRYLRKHLSTKTY